MHIIPLYPNTKLSKDQCPELHEDKITMSKVPYREAIGLLVWAAVATWPDIAFTVSLLSQFLKNPGETHWNAVKRVLKYLKGTKNYKFVGCIYASKPFNSSLICHQCLFSLHFYYQT